LAIGPDLVCLLDMEWLARLVILQGRALQVHAQLRGPHRRRVRTRPPPDALAQALGMGLQPQQAGWVRKHRTRTRLCKTLALQNLEQNLRVLPSHVGIRFTLGGLIAEIAPAVDDLLWRASTDAELQAATR